VTLADKHIHKTTRKKTTKVATGHWHV